MAELAIGGISFGIQVLQGLVTYLRAVKGRRSEIREALADAQAVVSIFCSLNDLLPRVGQFADTAAIESRLRDTEECLADIYDILDGLGVCVAEGFRGKSREAAQTLAYPFRKETVVAIRQRLGDLKQNLEVAIGIATLESNVATAKRVDEVTTVIAELTTESVTQKRGIAGLTTASLVQTTAITGLATEYKSQAQNISDLSERCRENATTLDGLRTSLDDAINDLSQRVEQTAQQVVHLGDFLGGQLTVASENARMGAVNSQAIVDMLASYHAEVVSRLPPEPSARASRRLQDRMEYQGGMELYARGAISTLSPARGQKMRLCRCPPVRKSSYKGGFLGLRFQFASKEPLKHQPGCSLYGIETGEKTQRTISAQVPVALGRLLFRASHMCMAYTTGQGTLGGTIRLRNVVPQEHSAVYAYMNPYPTSGGLNDDGDEEIPMRIREVLESVLTLYREGKASPMDRDEFGWSHAKAFVNMLFHGRRSVRLGIFKTDGAVTAAIEAHRTLALLAGGDEDNLFFPEIETHWVLGKETRVHSVISHLVSVSENWNPKDILFTSIDPGLQPFLKSLDHVYEEQFPPLTVAILRRSLVDLDRCILHDPGSVTKIVLGFTPLLLCTTWPEGLARLLETEGKTHIDGHGPGKPPLIWAVKYEVVESVEILARAGCNLDTWYDQQHFWEFSSEPFPVASNECLTVIVSYLLERRRQLISFARRELGDLDPSIESHWDRGAADLCARLEARGVRIPPRLRVPPDYATVYHWSALEDLYDFSLVFDLGFRDNGAPDAMGLTPFMARLTGREILGWLKAFPQDLFDDIESRGFFGHRPEDPWGMGINVRATDWYYIAAVATVHQDSYLGDAHFILENICDRSAADEDADDCVCWCTPGARGCSPLHLLLRTCSDFFELQVGEDGDRVHNTHRQHLIFHRLLDPAHVGAERAAASLPHLIRLLTFEALDMTHTCCTMRSVDRSNRRARETMKLDAEGYPEGTHAIFNCDPATAEHVRSGEREKEAAFQLESLMDEVAEEIKALESCTAEDFVWGYWRRRISELFRVDAEVVAGMADALGEVETHVLPLRTQALLGPEFELLRGDGLNEGGDKGATWHCPSNNCPYRPKKDYGYRGQVWKSEDDYRGECEEVLGEDVDEEFGKEVGEEYEVL